MLFSLAKHSVLHGPRQCENASSLGPFDFSFSLSLSFVFFCFLYSYNPTECDDEAKYLIGLRSQPRAITLRLSVCFANN